MLFKCKIVDNPFCIDCPNEIETVEHLLSDCPKSKVIWKELSELFMSKENKQISPTIQNTIYVTSSRNPKIQRWNYIALLAKFYIHRSRLHSSQLSWQGCKAFLRYKLGMEIYQAKQDQKNSKVLHWSIWDAFASNP